MFRRQDREGIAVKGLLLAAGKGTRLQPLTNRTPKPLLKVGGRPILSWIMEGLQDEGVDEIGLIVGHLGDQIREYYGDGAQMNMRLRYFEQTVRNGTAGAVLPAVDFLRDVPFFLGYGDILVDRRNYSELFKKFHENTDSSIISGWPSETPWAGGVLRVDSRDRLLDLVEKPSRALYENTDNGSTVDLDGNGLGNLINAGLMIFQPEIISHIEQVKPSPRGELELTDAMLELARASTVRVHRLHTFWSDIGTPEKLKEADEYFTRLE